MTTVREIKTGAHGTVQYGKSVHYVTWLDNKGPRKEGWVHQVGAHKFPSQFEVVPDKKVEEDAPVNNVGSGNIAGITPPKVLLKRKQFAGQTVFEVDGDRFHKARMGKKKYLRYEAYVGADEIGEEIRQYGRSNPGAPIILQHEGTGAMMYLKYGRYNDL